MKTMQDMYAIYAFAPKETLQRFEAQLEQRMICENRLEEIGKKIEEDGGAFKTVIVGGLAVKKINPLIAEEIKLRASHINICQHLERFVGLSVEEDDEELSEFE